MCYNSIDVNMFISTFTPEKSGPFQELRALNDIFQGPMAWLDCGLMLRRQEGLELARVGRSQFPAIRPWRWEEVVDQEVHGHGYMTCMKYYEMYIYIQYILKYYEIMRLWKNSTAIGNHLFRRRFQWENHRGSSSTPWERSSCCCCFWILSRISKPWRFQCCQEEKGVMGEIQWSVCCFLEDIIEISLTLSGWWF